MQKTIITCDECDAMGPRPPLRTWIKITAAWIFEKTPAGDFCSLQCALHRLADVGKSLNMIQLGENCEADQSVGEQFTRMRERYAK